MNGRQLRAEEPEVSLPAPAKPKTEAQEKLQDLEEALMDLAAAHLAWIAATERMLQCTTGAVNPTVIEARARLQDAAKIRVHMSPVWQEIDALTKLLRSYREVEIF